MEVVIVHQRRPPSVGDLLGSREGVGPYRLRRVRVFDHMDQCPPTPKDPLVHHAYDDVALGAEPLDAQKLVVDPGTDLLDFCPRTTPSNTTSPTPAKGLGRVRP